MSAAAADAWRETDVVFNREGDIRVLQGCPGLLPRRDHGHGRAGDRHPNETRHTGVSIMSNNGVEIRDISDMVGHKNTNVTETVYRHVIAPSVKGSASVMDNVFAGRGKP